MYFLLVIIATLLFSLSVLIDKYSLEKKYDSYRKVMVIAFIYGSIFIIPSFYIIFSPKIVKLEKAIIIFVLSVLYFLSYAFYFKGLDNYDSAGTTILYKITTVLVVLSGILVFNETYNLYTGLGILFIFTASLLSSIDNDMNLDLNLSFFLIISSASILALVVIIQKYIFSLVLKTYTFGSICFHQQ